MKSLIYVADDDAVNLRMVQAVLEREGFDVECFENGDLLYEAFLQRQCNLVILDVLMPGNDGFTIGAKIRQLSNLPIIVLTGQVSDDDYIFGISLGLDVYLTKPFNTAKLVAHVRTLLIKAEFNKAPPAHNPRNATSTVEYADITIDLSKLTTYCNNTEFHLTNTELSLLRYMLENHKRAVSREELLNKIWGFDSVVGTRAIDDTMKRLRKKLADTNSTVSIDTVRGYGFRVNLV